MKTMRKAYVKMILLAVAAIALGVILLGGATFSFFTSKSQSNIAVTAGRVKFVATAELTGVTSAQWDTDHYGSVSGNLNGNTGTFINNGTVTYNAADNVLVLNHMSAGDGVSIEIAATNYSTINTKYRIEVGYAENDGLWEGLTFSCESNGVALDFTQSAEKAYTEWVELTPAANPDAGAQLGPFTFTIELPITANDDYQGTSCALYVNIFAIQANGEV